MDVFKNLQDNDMDIKSDFPSLQTNFTNKQNSECAIKQEMTHVYIKNEVDNDAFEKIPEVPLKVEIETEENVVELKDNCCNLCGKSFFNTGGLAQHVQLVHEKRQDHKCEICGKGYEHFKVLEKHIKVVHEGQKDQKC